MSDEYERETKDDRLIPSVYEAAVASLLYLTHACNPDGSLVYRSQLNPIVRFSAKYNILRHAGSLYAMALSLNRGMRFSANQSVQNAGLFLKSRIFAVAGGRTDMAAVWSLAEDSRSGSPLQAKLGGTSLGLASLVCLEQACPGSTSLDDLRRMGRFIRFMQKADGNYYSKFVPLRGGRTDCWTSLYYPGEAAFALAMLYEIDPQTEWLEAAYKSLIYLAASREDQLDVPADHWALLATARALTATPQHLAIRDRDRLLSHAVQIVDVMLREQSATANDSSHEGCFCPDGRTTPTSTRIEGLSAILKVLPDDSYATTKRRIVEAIRLGIGFLLRAQIREGALAGGMPRAIPRLEWVVPECRAEFLRRSTEVRIDYVQHSCCAMIAYLDTL